MVIVMRTNKDSIFEKWLWQPEALRAFLAAFTLTLVIVTTVVYVFVGAKALLILAFECVGVIVWMVFRPVGKRVAVLRDAAVADGVAPVDSLIVHDLIQSPGIAFLREHELVLIPIVGEQIELRLDSITSVRERTWFNGSRLWFKKGFWLRVQGRSRLGFAVPNSSAGAFRERFRQQLRQTPGDHDMVTD